MIVFSLPALAIDRGQNPAHSVVSDVSGIETTVVLAFFPCDLALPQLPGTKQIAGGPLCLPLFFNIEKIKTKRKKPQKNPQTV